MHKKRLLTISALFAFILILCVPTLAKDSFKYDIVDGYAIITAYIGEDTNITVPSQIDGHPVHAIDEDAFSETINDDTNSSQLESVTISEGIVDIGQCAFKGNSNLKKIVLPNSILEIGEQAFADCPNLISVNLPPEITHVGQVEGMFENSGIPAITIPAKVTKIPDITFKNCMNLTKVVIHARNAQFGFNVFGNCPENLVIYGYAESTTEDFCKENKLKFIKLPEKISASQKYKINFNLSKATLYSERNVIVKANIVPKNDDITLIWQSSDKKVADVEKGVVYAKKPGKTYITAKTPDGISKAYCLINVVSRDDKAVIFADDVGYVAKPSEKEDKEDDEKPNKEDKKPSDGSNEKPSDEKEGNKTTPKPTDKDDKPENEKPKEPIDDNQDVPGLGGTLTEPKPEQPEENESFSEHFSEVGDTSNSESSDVPEITTPPAPFTEEEAEARKSSVFMLIFLASVFASGGAAITFVVFNKSKVTI